MKSTKKGQIQLPTCGPSARELGVRPEVDIPVDSENFVHPSTGGMSSSSSPLSLPKHRRPIQLNGLGKDPVFGILESDLIKFELNVRQDQMKITHFLIEPNNVISIEQFQKEICLTKTDWQIIAL